MKKRYIKKLLFTGMINMFIMSFEALRTEKKSKSKKKNAVFTTTGNLKNLKISLNVVPDSTLIVNEIKEIFVYSYVTEKIINYRF